MYFTCIWLLRHFKVWRRKRPIIYLIWPDYPSIGLIKMRLLCPWIKCLGMGNARVDNKRIYKCRNISIFFIQIIHSRPRFYIILISYKNELPGEKGEQSDRSEDKVHLMCWQPIWQPTRSPIWQHAHQTPLEPVYYRCHCLLLKPHTLCVCLTQSVGPKQQCEKEIHKQIKKNKSTDSGTLKKKDESKGVFFNQRVQIYSLLRVVSIKRHVFTWRKPFNKHASERKTLIKTRMCEITEAAALLCVCVCVAHHACMCVGTHVQAVLYLQFFQKRSTLALTLI